MPPPLFDGMQITNALRNDALPSLERLAQNPSLHDRALARFDRDEPPPYTSSTEDEDENEYEPYKAPDCVDSAILDELHGHLDEPLTSDQTDRVAAYLQGESRAFCPGVRYEKEAKLETDRVEMWARYRASDETRKYFVQYGPAAKGRAGEERINIIVRRNIKRRWQKLGVWSPEWGFPGREKPQPNDDTSKWKWPWQHGEAAAEWLDCLTPMTQNSRHPSARALRLRQGQRRSEYSPVLPRPHLKEDVSASQAESFIISRPWFMFSVEVHEEMQRYRRLPYRLHQLYSNSPFANVRGLWQERGDWEADWQDPNGGRRAPVVIGWKWRHESPSPEPEDLSGLDDLTTFELTPSEVDALEAVRPPSPPTPPRRDPTPVGGWPPMFGSKSRDPLPPLFGSKSPDPLPAAEEAVEQPPARDLLPTAVEASEQPPAAGRNAIEHSQPSHRSRRQQPQAGDHQPAAAEAREQPPVAGDDAIQQPQPRRRSRRLQPPSQHLRRSARIAAIAANCLPAPLVSKPPARRGAPPRKKRKTR